MLTPERRKQILQKLQNEREVLVADLAKEYSVSDETIRRDLKALEKDGSATRTYGGAVLQDGGEVPFVLRKKTNVEAKTAIAQQVAELIDDGDFIMLDESSTSSFIARAICHKKNITLITNSVELLLELAGVKDWNVLLSGGALKSMSLALTGNQTERFIRSYHVNKAVISCAGMDPDAGITDSNDDNAQIKRAMMESAEQTILALDHRKFDKKAFASIGPLNRISTVVTDREPSEKWRDVLTERGIRLFFGASGE